MKSRNLVVLSLLAMCMLLASCADRDEARPGGSEHISHADVSNVTIPLEGGDELQLHDGRARIAYGGASADEYSLAGLFADGRLAGSPGAAMILINNSAGSGNFVHVVAVRRTKDGLVASQPFQLGDRVPVRGISISADQIQVTFLDRGQRTSFSDVNKQVVVTLAVTDAGLEEVDRRTVSLTEVPLPRDNPDVRALSGVQDGVTEPGEIGYGQVQSYEFDAPDDQILTTELDGPLGLFLAIHKGSTYLTKPTDRITEFKGALPTPGKWTVDVISLNGQTSGYQLAVDLEDATGSEPVAESTQLPTPEPPSGRGKVAYLTFDDGPSTTYTRQVLDLLAQYDAKATFFVVGSQARAHPELLDAITSAGHSLGNHTWSHASLAGMSKSEFDREVEPVKRLLGDRDTSCLRPPYGAKDGFTTQYAAALGYRLALWDIDTQDWDQPGVKSIVNAVTRNIRPGSVILMHDAGGDRQQTVAALKQLLPRLKADGWRFEALC